MGGDRDSDANPKSDEDPEASQEEDDEDDDDDEALEFISEEDPECKSGGSRGTISYTVLDQDRLRSLQARRSSSPAHLCCAPL